MGGLEARHIETSLIGVKSNWSNRVESSALLGLLAAVASCEDVGERSRAEESIAVETCCDIDSVAQFPGKPSAIAALCSSIHSASFSRLEAGMIVWFPRVGRLASSDEMFLKGRVDDGLVMIVNNCECSTDLPKQK